MRHQPTSNWSEVGLKVTRTFIHKSANSPDNYNHCQRWDTIYDVTSPSGTSYGICRDTGTEKSAVWHDIYGPRCVDGSGSQGEPNPPNNCPEGSAMVRLYKIKACQHGLAPAESEAPLLREDGVLLLLVLAVALPLVVIWLIG